MQSPIPIYKPDLEKYSLSAIKAIKSGWISNLGENVKSATNLLQEITGAKHAILMANGTCATHCLFLSLRHKYPNIRKIYVPNNVYVAAWNCALMEYDLDQLEVMKMDLETWNVDTSEEYLKTLEVTEIGTVAMLVVHNLGQIVDVDKIKSVLPNVIIVEDNCEGVFGRYHNRMTGTSPSTLCSSISFYGNKTVTTGEGGAFLTNDAEVYQYVSMVYTQGMSQKRYIHSMLAYNYRMTNVQAGFLLDQLKDLDAILHSKKVVFERYKKLFEPLIRGNSVILPKEAPDTEPGLWMFAIRMPGMTRTFDELSRYFNERNIDIRPFFYPINYHEHFKKVTFDDDNSHRLSREVIMLPSFPQLTEEQQIYIVKQVEGLIKNDPSVI